MKYVIIGSSIAALRACDAIRQHDFDGEIVLCVQDSAFTGIYDHLSLYKLLEEPKNDIHFATETDMHERGIEVLKPQIVGMSLDEKVIYLKNGENLSFDRLLFAMDAVPKVPDVDGSDLDGVQTFWTLDDVTQLANRIPTLKGAQAAILSQGVDILDGDGKPGLQLTHVLREFGVPVTFVTSQTEVGTPLLDTNRSQELNDMLEADGVDVVCSASVVRMVGDEMNHLQYLILDDDTVIDASVAVITMGVQADLSLVDADAVEVGHGIVVNETLQTNHPDVYAAGYVTEQFGYLIRTQQEVAEQGYIAGMNMTGVNRSYSAVRSGLDMSLDDIPFTFYR